MKISYNFSLNKHCGKEAIYDASKKCQESIFNT